MKYKRGTNETSTYRGVSYSKSDNRWLAQICHKYNREIIGRFQSEEEAALAYNIRAIELLGRKARLNIID